MICFYACCHYPFSANSFSNRCPDCGKQQFSGCSFVHKDTGKEIDKYKRIKIDKGKALLRLLIVTKELPFIRAAPEAIRPGLQKTSSFSR